MGTDKGYIGRLVNRALEPDFRASTIGHLKKTLSNYCYRQLKYDVTTTWRRVGGS